MTSNHPTRAATPVPPRLYGQGCTHFPVRAPTASAPELPAFFGAKHDATSRRCLDGEVECLGALVHEIRNYLQTATLGFAALQSGKVAIDGPTGAIVKHSLVALAKLLQTPLDLVRAQTGAPDSSQVFSVASLIAEASSIASLRNGASRCVLHVPEVDADLSIAGNRDQLLAALVNLLQNAFKFTHPDTEVVLHAYRDADQVFIDVKDHCGGLPEGFAAKMFKPFTQGSADRTGLGLGLAIARRNVEADGGSLTVRDEPGTGCVFTLSVPLHAHDLAVNRLTTSGARHRAAAAFTKEMP